jgi:hypothetical protein
MNSRTISAAHMGHFNHISFCEQSICSSKKRKYGTCTEDTVFGAVKHTMFVSSLSGGDTHGQAERLKAKFSAALERISKEKVAAVNGIFFPLKVMLYVQGLHIERVFTQKKSPMFC